MKIIYPSLIIFCASSLTLAQPRSLEQIIEHYLTTEEWTDLTRGPHTPPQEEFLASEDLEQHAWDFVTQIITQHNKYLAQLPPSLQKKITSTIQSSVTTYNKLAKKTNQKLTKKRWEAILSEALGGILNKTPDYVNVQDVAATTDQSIRALFRANYTKVKAIPECMLKEFEERKEVILTQLKQRMMDAKVDYVTTQEIDTIVAQILTDFITRMQYVLTWQWVNGQLEDIKKVNRKTPCSSLPNEEKHRKAYEALKFLDKKLKKD